MVERSRPRHTLEQVKRWVESHAPGRSVPEGVQGAPRPEPLPLDVAQRNFDEAFLTVPFNVDRVFSGLTGVIDSVHAQSGVTTSDLAACEVRATEAAAAARKNGLSGHAQIYLRIAAQHSTENHLQKPQTA